MESKTINLGDFVTIKVEDKVLFYNREKKYPFLAEVSKLTAAAFRNAVFQILPASLNPCEKGNKYGTSLITPVSPDTQFILYHPETNTVLSAIESGKNGNQVLAVRNVDETTRFKFLGGLQSGNENYRYESKLSLEACKIKSYFSVGDKEPEYLYNLNPSNSFTRTTSDFAKVVPRRCPYFKLDDVYKVGLEEKPSPVKLERYKAFVDKENPSVIHNGDYVRIRYDNQWLSYYPNSENRNEPFFESVNDNYQSMNHSHTVFQIVGENTGEALETKNRFMLKHFMSSEYVYFKNTDLTLKMNEATPEKDAKDDIGFCLIETENKEENVIKEKLSLNISFEGKEQKFYLKPTEASPVKNVQFEVNTLYFFGFRIPEEYTYKNLKSLQRNLAETTLEFENEEYNVVIEKVTAEDVEAILSVEAFANELQNFVDYLSVSIPEYTGQKSLLINPGLAHLLEKSEEFLKHFFITGKLNQNDSSIQGYDIKVPNRYLQNLVREFRIFDLIHIINFLLIKKNYAPAEFDAETFLDLYKSFCDIMLAAASENIPNRFYNSQFIRIYIHFMSDECDGVFKGEVHEDLRHKMKYKTISVLKFLLWDEDLDGLGQLNFYQTLMFAAIRNAKGFHTYYIDLVEHISSSKAYNLTNSFRDAFITSFCNENFKYVFPKISLKNEEVIVNFEEDDDLTFPLSGLLQSHEEAFNYLIATLKLLIALSTSKLITYYHCTIKNYPLKILQACYNSPTVHISVRMLCHTLFMSSYYNYLKLPFQFIPNTIQTSNDSLRGSLNTEDSKIVEHCKSIIGTEEKNYLKTSEITEEVEGSINVLNTQDCSVQVSLIQKFLEEDPSPIQITYCLTYITFILDSSTLNIQLLNKVKECLIRIRNKASADTANYRHLPKILEIFTLVNQKMKVHSTNAIYTQVIKTKNSNAEEYARKIITGLKKIHTESFAPFDMIGLNEPIISSVAMRYLMNVARYEESIADELHKFVILSSQKEIDQVRDLIDLTLQLNETVRKFNIQKEKQNKITCNNSEFVLLVEKIEKVFKIIYNTKDHFRFHDDDLPQSVDKHLDPEERFFVVLRLEKAPFRDRPFKLRAKAVSKLHQSIFALLNVHDVLLQLLNITVTLVVENKDSNAPAEIYLARAVLITLTAFTLKNKNNQDLLANSHGFVSLYYQQKYIDKSCDTLTLFAEVMRDNETLLEVTKKFIYDITCYTFLGTIKPRIVNKESGAYLATAIMAMHFLHDANIPSVTYDTYNVAETKFNNIFTEDFSKNDLVKLIKDKGTASSILIDLPPPYYNIRELMISMYKIIRGEYEHKKFNDVAKFRKFFKCKIIIESLCSPTFRTQFELKNLFLRFIKKIMFSGRCPCPAFFVTDPSAAKEFIAYLVNELLEFLLFKSPDKSEIKGIQQKIVEIDSKNIARHETDYEELRKLDLDKARLQIYLDDIPVSVVYERLYIFSQAWKFTAKLAVLYPQMFINSGVFDSFLSASELLIEHTNVSTFEILRSLKKYFSKFTEIGVYESFWIKIKSITEKICQKFEALGQEVELIAHRKEKNDEDATEKTILRTIVDNMKATKEKNEQNNIENFYEVIKLNVKKSAIWSEFLTVLQINPANLHKGIYNFIVKFLEFSFRKVTPSYEQNPQGNSFMFNQLYELQDEFSHLHAEERIVEAISIVQNTKNLFAITDLILSFSEGFNTLIIQKLSNSIEKALQRHIPSNKYYRQATPLLKALLNDLANRFANSECGRVFEYVAKSYEANSNEPEILTDEMDIIFHSQFERFIESNSNDINQSILELGPLNINLHTISGLFKASKSSNIAVNLAKEQLTKAIKSYDFQVFLHGFYMEFVDHNDLEKINPTRNELLLALDIWIRKIKCTIVSMDL